MTDFLRCLTSECFAVLLFARTVISLLRFQFIVECCLPHVRYGGVSFVWAPGYPGRGPLCPPPWGAPRGTPVYPPVYPPQQTPKVSPQQTPKQPSRPPPGVSPGVSLRCSPGCPLGCPRGGPPEVPWGIPREVTPRGGTWGAPQGGQRGPRPGCSGVQTKETPPYLLLSLVKSLRSVARLSMG